MKKDTHKTKVTFYYNEGNADLYALFNDSHFTDENNKVQPYACYSHIGQHSGVHFDYVKESRLATESEYKDLKLELESIGYKLTVLNK